MTDQYAHHLAAVSQHNTVTVSENIHNAAGVLLVAEGTEVSVEVAERLAKHKLEKNLDVMISLRATITADDLVRFLLEQRTHPEIDKLMQKRVALTKFEHEASKLANYPLIQQKLTVLRDRMPMHFNHAVMGAYVSVLLAQELSLSPIEQHTVFVAALVRDVGFLHLAPDLNAQKPVLNSDEWKILKGHVVIAYQFLTMVPALPAQIKIAVLEHHERTDGLGYPRHRLLNDLSLEGQIVAFADMMIDCFDRFIWQNKFSLRSLVPALQLNSSIHTRRVSRAALRLFDRFVESSNQRFTDKDIAAILPHLLKQQAYARNWFAQAKEVTQVLQTVLTPDIYQRADLFLARIEGVLADSGIMDPMFLEWLMSLRGEELNHDDILDIEEFKVMLIEAGWQFNYALMTLTDMFEKPKASLPEALQAEIDNRTDLLYDLLQRFCLSVQESSSL